VACTSSFHRLLRRSSSAASNRSDQSAADLSTRNGTGERSVTLDPAGILRLVSQTGGIATGVPCSHLGGLFEAANNAPAWRFVPSVNEGQAIALACGVIAAGGAGIVGMQNSGLGHALDPLLSLAKPHKIAVPILVTHRGDASVETLPHHLETGRITRQLLRLLDVPVASLDDRAAGALAAWFASGSAAGTPTILLVRYGAIAECRTVWRDVPERAPLAVRAITQNVTTVVNPKTFWSELASLLPDDTVVVGTTGHISRALHLLGDAPQYFYVTGAMGYASSFSLGVHLQRGNVPVLVIDGDGSSLMHLANMATIGATAGARYKHVILDNGANASTGNQPTVSATVSFPAVAAALGYRESRSHSEFTSVGAALEWLLATSGPALLHVNLSLAPVTVPPRVAVSPHEQTARFTEWLEHQPVAISSSTDE
jgi:phosphonopyruvate decarboxylase